MMMIFTHPDRVNHAVNRLRGTPTSIMAAGSSVIHIYFKHIDTIYEFGPYGPRPCYSRYICI